VRGCVCRAAVATLPSTQRVVSLCVVLCDVVWWRWCREHHMAGPTAKLLSAIALAPTRYAFMSRAWRVLSAHPSLPAFTTRTSEAVVEYPHLASALCLFFSSLVCVLA